MARIAGMGLVVLIAVAGCDEDVRDGDRCPRAIKQTIPHWEEYALRAAERATAARKRARSSEDAMLDALEAQADVSITQVALAAARRVELEARLVRLEGASTSLEDASRRASKVFARALGELSHVPDPLRRSVDAATGWCR